jgi:chromosome partitioning protein
MSLAKTITFAIQKGGASKTLSSCTTSYLLSEMGYKVLHVDMDSQANSSQMLAQIEDPTEAFGENTVLDAIIEKNAAPFITKLTDHLHLLPADEYLATLDQFLMKSYNGNPSLALKIALEPIKEQYSAIVIDTNPSLSLPTVNSICASDFTVIMYEPSKFCHAALPRFIRTLEDAQREIIPDIKIAGILRTLIDSRRNDTKELVEMVAEDYPGLCFNTIIHRRASTGRLPIFGYFNNSEVKEATKQYQAFVEELIERCQIHRKTVSEIK